MQLVPYNAVLSRTKELARDLDLDLLFRTHLFIPRKILRDAVREFGGQLGGKLLDVGCGSQQYRAYLNYQHYFGIEWSSAKRPPVVADVCQIPFRDAAFDSALCTEVLEHLPEPGKCLSEIHRVVKPGGSVFFTVPMTVHTHSEPHDFYRYTQYGLRYQLEKHGFEIVTLRRLGGVASVIASRGINLGCEVASEHLDRSKLKRLRRMLLMPLSAGGSLAAYGLSKLMDRVEQRDAIGWAAMCRRLPN
jgi:SAM-dependent methyltransferase